MAPNHPLQIFLKVTDSPDIKSLIELAFKSGCRGVVTSVVNSSLRREFLLESLVVQNFARSPLTLEADQWFRNVVPYLEPENLNIVDEEIRRNNEIQFRQEISFAVHLAADYGNIAVKLENDPEVLGLCLTNLLEQNNFLGKLLVEVPMTDNKTLSSMNIKDHSGDEEGDDPWKDWNKCHAATEYDFRVEVALVMSTDLPSDEELKRWLGERIGMLVIPTNCFLSNKNMYPVLSPKHREWVVKFLQYTHCSIVLEACEKVEYRRIKLFVEYIEHLSKQKVISSENQLHEDNVAYPLQPLHDNLHTAIYENFERDPIKYKLYQKAIEKALIDKVPDAEKDSKTLVLMVLGAGRGPLVRAAINAYKNTGRRLKILVVEKNQNAIVTLSSLIETLWPNENITLISKDMRKLELKEKADIIVSELLGSFGDNELSPECLDGAQNLLKPDGISIPCDSVSYLRPVMSTINYISTRDHSEKRKIKKSYSNASIYMVPLEMSWQCYFSSAYFIDEPKELFKFVHPNHQVPIDNTRHGKLKFKSKIDSLMHGFAGYFTSKLYNNIEMSILPATHTPEMFSWFPIYFPITEPLYLKANEEVTCEFWRKVDTEKVWYEWRVNDGPILNEGGKNHPILLLTS